MCTQKDLISSHRSWSLGGRPNSASEEAFRRWLGVNTIWDPRSTLCGRCDKNCTCYVRLQKWDCHCSFHEHGTAQAGPQLQRAAEPRAGLALLLERLYPLPFSMHTPVETRLRLHLQVEECLNPLEKINHATRIVSVPCKHCLCHIHHRTLTFICLEVCIEYIV